MSFYFHQTTISGGRFDTEGTAAGIQEIARVMTNHMGWTTHDDRTNQAGANHKMVLRTVGEDPGPAFYLIMTSGSSGGSVGQNEIGMQIATAWDETTHAVPASGVIAPTATTSSYLITSTNGFYSLAMSGDKDAVLLHTRVDDVGDRVFFGRCKNFLPTSLEPYGLYLLSDNNNNAALTDQTTTKAIVGNPPIALEGSSDAVLLSFGFSTTNEPRIGIASSAVAPIFTAFPVVLFAQNTSPVEKGAIGIARNAWAFLNNTAGLNDEMIFTVSGSSETYMAFIGTSESFVIRRT